MTFRTPMFLAASLLLASHAAYASPTPVTTDEARVQAHSLLPLQSSIPVRDFTATPTNSDEARDQAHGLLPLEPAIRVADGEVTPATSDQARELAHRMLP